MNDYLEQRMYELDSMMFSFGFEVIKPKGVQCLGDPWYEYWTTFIEIRRLFFTDESIGIPRV